MVLGNIAHYLYEKRKETFQQSSNIFGISFSGLIWQILNLTIFVFAIYLSFKRNNGFDLGSFLAACCCSICYVVYALAVPISQL